MFKETVGTAGYEEDSPSNMGSENKAGHRAGLDGGYILVWPWGSRVTRNHVDRLLPEDQVALFFVKLVYWPMVDVHRLFFEDERLREAVQWVHMTGSW